MPSCFYRADRVLLGLYRATCIGIVKEGEEEGGAYMNRKSRKQRRKRG